MSKSKKKLLTYIERDVSWMYFNHRILQEARKKDVPLLERLSFLGIYSNNLDEFFRVRMASLNRIIESKNVTDEMEKKIKSLPVLVVFTGSEMNQAGHLMKHGRRSILVKTMRHYQNPMELILV